MLVEALVNAKRYGFVNMKVKKEVYELIQYLCNEYNINVSNLLSCIIIDIDDDDMKMMMKMMRMRQKRHATLTLTLTPYRGGVLFAKKYLRLILIQILLQTEND